MSARAAAPKTQKATKSVPVPEPEPVPESKPKRVPKPVPEPVPQIEDLEDDAVEAEAAPEPQPDPELADQKIFKLTAFIDDLKSTYPKAKRFNLYLFTDKVQVFENAWSDAAPAVFFKPALVVVSLPDSKPVLLTNDKFNTKFGTANWGITFNQSKTRALDKSATVNILKVLPDQQMFNNNPYYNSRLFKPDATEQKLAQNLTNQIHDQFPVFQKSRRQRDESTPADEPPPDISFCI
jgi:hypothetical protein